MVEPRTVLDALAADMASASGDQAALSALTPVGQITLRGEAACLPLASAALGVALPSAANRFESDGARAALWLGPDEWLVLVPRPEVATTIARFQMALAGYHYAAVDTSAGRLGLEIAGPAARTVMEKGCHLDLHPRQFGPGHVAQSTFARVPAIILQRDERPTYWLLVRPSYSVYLARWAIDAMAEFHLAPIPAR
ncbi:sarcosine oxidase subunit gamma [Stella humosa]|uniref:Sarcosine oxidase subunit gamma n=1 Tax=Stella humosa TaxID=94 RepID=A0A3N1MDJ2_9PROT|nr:sarcosine oxidase subunit gamma family protein [Stella humosa]ROQ01801.1 sarcosine oxidase subunit gamma [Stella humosa]BBK32188.1 sarcosine oxidase subunit gamma [Stella humosa]